MSSSARTFRALAVSIALLGPVGNTHAEDAPPSGPAQIFQRQAADQDARDRRRNDAPEPAVAAGTAVAPPPGAAPPVSSPENAGPPEGAAGARDPHAEDSQAHRVLREPEMATAVPAPELAKGTIRIDVVRPDGQPFADAKVVLGVMGSNSQRTEQTGSTTSDGSLHFAGLPVGGGQAYRVNVHANGAKFSSTPFRLPERGGYRVRVPVLRTTRSDKLIFQLIGQTVVELRDDRLHITQQARIANADEDVFVLPEDGLVVELPAEFTAFQWQDQMTDQRGEQVLGKGFKIRGSIPPGNVTLGWGYDLPRAGASARIPVKLPFRTYTYRVISEAPDGLTMRVSEFPEPERIKDEGRTLLFTQVQRKPTDAVLNALTIKLDGIPGPGPGRYVAVVLAAIAVALGLYQASRRAADSDDRRAALAERKRALIAAVKQVDAEHARGEVGPEFHAGRVDDLTSELALVLRDEEALPAPALAGRPARA